jgi:transposase
MQSSPLRRVGRSMGQHRPRNHELSEQTRAAIVAAYASGQGASKLAQRFGCSRQAVYGTLRRYNETKSNTSKPRQGRPCKLNEGQSIMIIRTACHFYAETWDYILHLTNAGIGKSTLKALCKAHGLRKYRSRTRPKLDEARAAVRLAFCQFWEGREEELMSVFDPI